MFLIVIRSRDEFGSKYIPSIKEGYETPVHVHASYMLVQYTGGCMVLIQMDVQEKSKKTLV